MHVVARKVIMVVYRLRPSELHFQPGSTLGFYGAHQRKLAPEAAPGLHGGTQQQRWRWRVFNILFNSRGGPLECRVARVCLLPFLPTEEVHR